MLWTASATWSKTSKDPTWSRIQAVPPHLGTGHLCWWFKTHWLVGSSVVWILWSASVVQRVKVSLCIISTWISSIQLTSAIAGWVNCWVWWASRVMLLCSCCMIAAGASVHCAGCACEVPCRLHYVLVAKPHKVHTKVNSIVCSGLL